MLNSFLALTLWHDLAWTLALCAMHAGIGSFTSSANAAVLAIVVCDGDSVRGFAINQAVCNIARLAGIGGHLLDITRGTNSGFVTPQQACGGDYLCVARPGYDAPTGLGTPNGIGAF